MNAMPEMKDTCACFEQLFEMTGDLLYRVRIYDREMIHCDDITAMDDIYETIKNSRWMMHNELWLETMIDRMNQMKIRLLTIMENLLYTI